MKGLKIELLGIGVLLLGLALSTGNFWGYVGGILGFAIAAAGCFFKEEKGR